MTKRFDVVYEEDDEYKNIRYWEIKDNKCGATTSNELKICHLLNNLNDENEQLKQQEKRLYKYFRKCFDNVSEQGFRETWEMVKKYD